MLNVPVTVLLVNFKYTLHTTAQSSANMVAQRWSNKTAWEWHNAQDWQMGANFLPSTASNQLEMWQHNYWQRQEPVIHRELEWASEMGYNAMRVFLHNLVYEHEGEDVYLNRIERFLEIASSHGIRILLVFFDGCWDPYPRYGKQEEPRPYIHNSRWVQSPGREILENPSNYSTTLKPYVQSILRRFGNDTRVLLFDMFNEPDNPNKNSYGHSNVTRVPAAQHVNGTELEPHLKVQYSVALLNATMQWAREVGPIQTPLTVAIRGSNDESLEKLILETVDVISFHNYDNITELAAQTQHLLSTYGRPVVCSEYMARPQQSTFDPNLGYLRNQSVFSFNWGFVSGRSQTIYPWNSWTMQYNESSLDVWFHDVLQKDGKPYNESEYDYILQVANGGASSAFWDYANTQLWWMVLPAVLALLIVFGIVGVIRRQRRRTRAYQSGAAAEEDLTDNDLELL